MTRLFIGLFFILVAILNLAAKEQSFSIVFGNEQTSTNTLSNATFINSVKEGKSYIDKVTSVVAVFPDQKDCIRLSSSKTYGKFNISLAEGTQVVAKRIVVKAARYDNERDADASLMVNSETLYITDTYPGDYTIEIPSRPEKTLTNLIVDAEYRVYIYSITVFYDDSQGIVDPEKDTVATPEIIPSGGEISSGTNISISCQTNDATIYYTTDGKSPTSASTLYTEPFALYADATVKTFAVRAGMNSSEVVEATFKIRNPETSLVSYFNFNNPSSLTPPVAEPSQKEDVLLDGRTFTDGDVAVSFAATGSGNTPVRLYNSYDAGCDLRIYQGDRMTVTSLNNEIWIEEIAFEVSESSGSQISLSPSEGSLDFYTDIWTPGDEKCFYVDFVAEFQTRIKSMTVTLKAPAGISDLRYDHDTKEAWYTIDGFRVPANIATPGFYIRVTTSGSDKIIVR